MQPPCKRRNWVQFLAGAPLLILLALLPAAAQTNHSQGHPQYSGWVNQKGTGCCNNQDCGELADADVREDGGQVEVRVDGQWCEVQPWMYLRSGNTPNWAASHACVVPDSTTLTDRRPCARLICFQPRPGT